VAAIEHSGFQVLDANGTYVDRLLWSEAGLVFGEGAPFALAGIAVDPGRGDLYLVENSGVQTHVWIRLDPSTEQSIVHGVFGSVVHGPDSSCLRRLPLVPPLNFFSLTYRDADGMLWTNEFNSGVAYTVDPKSGKHTSQGFLGANDVWGMAYDPERDVIYCLEEDFAAGYPIHVLDPNTMQSTPLPNPSGFMREIAFDSDDGHIYGIGFDGASILQRVDRDTGIATVVGPTVGGSGIAYDRATGMLVTISSGTLYDVDPATGTATIRALVSGAGWEGLAAIPILSEETGAPVTGSSAAISLRAYPNPSRGVTNVSFESTRPGRVVARVLDVRGRVVRELPPTGPLDIGVHTLSWDGRAQGIAVAPGVYFVEIRQGEAREIAKVIVVR
jgi:hypothetical protein